jgi:translation elongation factor P/translation initiation factor 5A
MDENNLKEGIVVDESHELCNVLNFHDFVMEEGKKEAKKSRPKVKNYEEFTDEMEGDFTDPNDNPKRFIKLREQFIEEE